MTTRRPSDSTPSPTAEAQGAQILALPAETRAVATFIAVVGLPVARSHILPCLRALSIRRRDGGHYTSKDLGPLFEDLAERGLATYDLHLTLTPDAVWGLLMTTPRAALEPLLVSARAHFSDVGGPIEATRRELTFALLDGDAAAALRLIERGNADNDREWILHGAFAHLPAAALSHARAAGPELFALMAAERLRVARIHLAPSADLVSELEDLAARYPLPAAADLELARHLVLQGRPDAARQAADRHPTDPATPAVLGLIAAAAGDRDAARLAFTKLRPPARRSKSWTPPPAATVERVVAALVFIGDPETRRSGRPKRLWGDEDPVLWSCGDHLDQLHRALLLGEPPNKWYGSSRGTVPAEGAVWSALCAGLAWVTVAARPPAKLISDLKALRLQADAAGASWLKGELAVLLRALEERAVPARSPSPRALLALLEFIPAWERRLQRLEQAFAPIPAPALGAADDSDTRQVRLAWVLDKSAWGGGLTVGPREQRRDARGRWSKGRPVALKRLHGTKPEYEPLTRADRAVCACIGEEVSVSRGYRNVDYYLDIEQAAAALAVHPNVYWADDSSQRVAVREVEPVLRVTRDGDELVLQLHPKTSHYSKMQKTGPAEVTIIRVRDVHTPIREVVDDELRVPAREVERVERFIATLGGAVGVEKDIGASPAGRR